MRHAILIAGALLLLSTLQLSSASGAPEEEFFEALPNSEAPIPTSGGGHEQLRKVFDSIPGGGAGQVLLLTDNLEAWAVRWWMMKNASSTIDTTYFIMEKDVFGMSFLGHLLKKGRLISEHIGGAVIHHPPPTPRGLRL